MKLAVIMFDDIEDRVNTQQHELDKFIDENNKVMFVANTDRAAYKIGNLNLSYNYLYFQDLGYIVNRNGLFVSYTIDLDNAVTIISNREKIDDCNIYVLGEFLDNEDENLNYHMINSNDKFTDFYCDTGEVDSFIKSLKY